MNETLPPRDLINQLEQLDGASFRDVLVSACWRRGGSSASGAGQTAGVVIECLHGLCNGSHREVIEAWWQVWSKEHPTIRQTVVRTFVGLMKRWVEVFTKGNWKPDARDEASYEFAEFLSQQDIHFPFI